MDDRNDRKRDRLSWSEVDKLRDKSQKRDRDPMQKQSSPAAMNAQKSYRAALEKAFASGKIGELARTLGKGNEDVRPQPHMSQPSAPPAAPAPEGVELAAAPASGAVAQPLPPTPTAVVRDPERENKQKLLLKIREAESRDAVSRSIDTFLGKYEKLPDDVEILTKCLGHKSDDRVRSTLVQLTVLIERDKPRRARTLIAQLRMIEETHGDPEIRAQAGQVRARL